MTDTQIERLAEFRGNDLADLCDAAEAAIVAGGGFDWLAPPRRDVMEAYWRGNLLVPGRTVFVGRLDGVIAGAAQLNRPRASSESQSSMPWRKILATFLSSISGRIQSLMPRTAESVVAARTARVFCEICTAR